MLRLLILWFVLTTPVFGYTVFGLKMHRDLQRIWLKHSPIEAMLVGTGIVAVLCCATASLALWLSK